ncbi:Piso0_001293 [Millerozyma farinosa CBS 7064]|uniref:ferric-chelate reductase (NADPH) n=1 Tax=Pichia sorbitophila (strain ATCC MYA-4447 / BCRC 22081 / CBS 7064 / NBRC 10061 / NRRL Y-12695) TaxID=559304 RepID=G8YDZ4_PICSO|nr:Piso0_001293 [Millerozyma farinosa CBS 7064]
MGLWKRNHVYKGLDCLADMDKPEYKALKKLSQAQVPWTDQPKYAKYTIYFGVVVIFIAFVKHVWYSVQDRRNRKIGGGAGNSFADVITAYSRFIGYKQLPTGLCYYTSLPESLGSTLFLAISTLYLFCWCFVPHFWYRECRGFGSSPLAVRAGIMATAVTPFVYILSGKSNMITLVTGVSYEKLNKFHQYVGLVAFVFGIVHTIPFIYQNLREGGSPNLHKNFVGDFYYYSGIPPLILLGLLCILSKAWFRKYMYEWFVNSHWAFGIAYFGTLWWHINDSLNMQNYMYAALAFWATQILYRIFIKTTFRPSKLFMRPREAEISRIDHEMLEISVKQHEDLSWKPGQHFFLRFPGTRILDNHPFSICSSSGISGEMKFIIKSKKGLTRVLRKEIETSLTAKKKVYLDGPYGGTSRDPLAFNKVILLSSGSGVSATIPFLTTLAQKMDESKTSSVLREVHFIWIVRHKDDINWVLRDLNQAVSQDNSIVKIDIYVCRDQETEAVKTKLSEDSLEKSIENVKEIEKGMNIIPGKPNVTEIMDDLKLDLKERTMFVLSGSDSLKREVQRNVADYQPLIFNSDLHNLGIREVYLHTESFGW